MKRNLQKIRSKTLPNSPENAAQILAKFETPYVRENYGLTIRNDPSSRKMFFQHAFENEDFAHCIFASPDIVDAIKIHIPIKDRQLFMDGTFKVCPIGIFNQLFIIHVNFMGQVNEMKIIIIKFD